MPLDEPTPELDQWAHRRCSHRPIPHPRTSKPTDFLITEHGRRLGATRLRNGLTSAVTAAGLHDAAGRLLMVTPHQQRHTYATTLANAEMSLQALMALLGHGRPIVPDRIAWLAGEMLKTRIAHGYCPRYESRGP